MAVLVAVTSVTVSSWICTWVPPTQPPAPVTPTLSPATMTVFVSVGGGAVASCGSPTCRGDCQHHHRCQHRHPPPSAGRPGRPEHIAHELIPSSGLANEPAFCHCAGTASHVTTIAWIVPRRRREAHHPERMMEPTAHAEQIDWTTQPHELFGAFVALAVDFGRERRYSLPASRPRHVDGRTRAIDRCVAGRSVSGRVRRTRPVGAGHVR